MSKTSRPRRHAAGNLQSKIATAAGHLCRAYMAWRTEQAMIGLLHSMSDRGLSDIGLCRSDIAGAVARMWVTDRVARADADREAPVGAALSPAGSSP